MKTFRILLIACVVQMVSAMGAWANSFSDMYMIMELAQTERIQIPELMPMVDLTESGRDGVMTLHYFEINTAEKASEVMLQYRVYEQGTAPGDSWQESATGSNVMGTEWKNNPRIDLIEGLEVGKAYILEFRMKGIGTDNTEFYYDNGGENYKIKFIKDNAPTVKFGGAPRTAWVTLNIDGTEKDFSVPNDMWDGVSLGKSSSISISKFRTLIDKYSSSASVAALRMNYGICKKGGEADYWYSTPATMNSVDYVWGEYSRETHWNETPVDIMEKIGELYPDGLQDGEEYELCIGFDFDDNEGNNRMLDNNGEAYRFAFVYSATQLGPDDRAEFQYTNVTLQKNGENMGFIPENSSHFDLTADAGVWGLTLYSLSTYASYPASEVKLNYRRYEGTTPAGEWKSLEAEPNGPESSYWSYASYDGNEPLDLCEGTEIGKTYTFEYYLSGITTTGKPFYLNNNGENFTIKFSPAPATEQFNYVKVGATVGLNTEVEEVEMNLPPYNMYIDDLSDGGRKANNVFTIDKITADMSVSATAFDLYYRVFQLGNNTAEWKKVSGTSANGSTWTCTSAVDVMAGLTKGKNYVLEFYFKATVNGSDVLFNNGDENYKLQFLFDDQDPDLGGTGFNVDGQKRVSFVMTSDPDNPYMYMYDLATCKSEYENGAVQLGEVPMLAFSAFRAMWQRESTDVEIADMSIQYKIYEPGQDGQWNGITATDSYYFEDQLSASSQCHDAFTFPGLESGKTYILEAMAQLRTTDDKYYFLNDTDESTNSNIVGFKFQFSITSDPTGIATVDAKGFDNATVYNLAGQRVGNDYKGIVIINGKKVLKK